MIFQENLKAGGWTVAKRADQTPQHASTQKFLDCEFHVDPGVTSVGDDDTAPPPSSSWR